MKKFILYLGLNDKDAKNQKITTKQAFKKCNDLLLQYVDGATVYQANGIYKHLNGQTVTEKTFIIELLFTNKTTVLKISNDLKKLFNQESIAIQEESINGYLV